MILCTLRLVILPVTVAATDVPVNSLLEQIEAGRLDLTPLEVTYDDRHPLHGGTGTYYVGNTEFNGDCRREPNRPTGVALAHVSYVE